MKKSLNFSDLTDCLKTNTAKQARGKTAPLTGLEKLEAPPCLLFTDSFRGQTTDQLRLPDRRQRELRRRTEAETLWEIEQKSAEAIVVKGSS